MDHDLIHTAILSGCFLAVFGTAELLFHRMRWKAESSRKFVHIFSGLLTLLFPILLKDHIYVLVLCGSFAILLLTSMRFSFLKSINGVERKTWGSIAFPAAIYGCFLYYVHTGELVSFYLPVLILALCDPIAAVTGKKWPKGRYRSGQGTKTMTGSAFFIISAFLIGIVLFVLSGQELSARLTTTCIAVAIAAGFTEGITGHGFDNITIPLAVITILHFYGVS